MAKVKISPPITDPADGTGVTPARLASGTGDVGWHTLKDMVDRGDWKYLRRALEKEKYVKSWKRHEEDMLEDHIIKSVSEKMQHIPWNPLHQVIPLPVYGSDCLLRFRVVYPERLAQVSVRLDAGVNTTTGSYWGIYPYPMKSKSDKEPPAWDEKRVSFKKHPLEMVDAVNHALETIGELKPWPMKAPDHEDHV